MRPGPPSSVLRALPDAGRDPQDAHEDRNLLLAARLLVAAALNRTQSVGAHYRADTDARLSLSRPLHAKDSDHHCHATAAPETVPSRAAALAGSLPEAAVLAVLRTALQEDAPYGDITSQTLIPAQARATAVLERPRSRRAQRRRGVRRGDEADRPGRRRRTPGQRRRGLCRRNRPGPGDRERPRRAAGRTRRH